MRPLAALVALLTLVTLELVRASGPLLDMTFGIGVVEAAVAAVVAYGVLPGLLGITLHLVVRRSARHPVDVGTVVVGTVALAAARLVVQALTGWPRFVVGLVAVALAVVVLASAVALLARRRAGGLAGARAIAVGAAGGVGLQLLLGTWDAIWRDGVVGWGVSTVLAVGLVLLARLVGRADDAPASAPDGAWAPGRVWALGPALALLAMVLANPAFSASQVGATMALAGPVTAFGLLLAGTLAPEAQRVDASGALGVLDRAGPWVGALLLAVAVAVLVPAVEVAADPFLLAALVPAQVLTIRALGRALEPRPVTGGAADRADRAGRADMADRAGRAPRGRLVVVGTGAVGLGTIVPLLVHQLDYDVPLGFPNALVVLATAVVLGLAAATRRLPPDAQVAGSGWSVRIVHTAGIGPGRTLVAVSTLLAVVGSVAVVTDHRATQAALDRAEGIVRSAPGTEPGEGRVLSWNLHYAVDPYGDVDLEQIARTIDRTGADVVLLQEVTRGWVLGGGVDAATWLANRLDMDVAFAPAADRQFGNAVLARGRITDAEVIALPYGAGPQNRSALRASVPFAGTRLDVVSVHLQHRDANTPTRLQQLETLLDALGDADATGAPLVVGGDLNAEPGWPEIDLLTGAGFVSAQDAVGDPSVLTSPTLEPRHRIDWVFVRGAEPTAHAVLVDALSSDHRPLVTDVQVD